MSILKDSSGKDNGSGYGQWSLLAAVPAVLLAGPAVGFFAGQWIDTKFETEPWLQIIGLFLGFGAAGVEIAGLVRKSQAMEEKREKKEKKEDN